jgi:2-amino-4-hydroxy-6-hydroxymethyldihydropteridine diphosphokinase
MTSLSVNTPINPVNKISPPRQVFLSLGANLGDREGTLREALRHLAALPETRLVAVSSISETPPWGKTDQPAFLNMAVEIATAFSPEALLDELHAIEQAFGRARAERWGPRTLDIDILVYTGEERDTAQLRLPHPWLTRRRFVLAPLAEIAPALCVHGKTVSAWLAALPPAVEEGQREKGIEKR